MIEVGAHEDQAAGAALAFGGGNAGLGAPDLAFEGFFPVTLAIHRGDGENPHAHLMFSERANDGIERSREQWFKRYNSKEPEKGGARKSMATRPKDWLEQTRKDWADHANQALERAGSRERITGASLEQAVPGRPGGR